MKPDVGLPGTGPLFIKKKCIDTYTQRRQVSAGLLRNAENINPAEQARLAHAKQKNSLARAQEAGLRNIPVADTGSTLNTKRRNALDMSRTNSAFQQQFLLSKADQRNAFSTALAAAPAGGRAEVQSAADRAAKQQERLSSANQTISDIAFPVIEDIFGKKKEDELERTS